MGQPVIVQVTGAATLAPAVSMGGPTLFDTMQVTVNAAYGASKAGRPSINAPSTPFVIPLEGVVKVRFFAFQTQMPMKLLVTSPNGGVDQVIPCSDRFVIHAPGAGDEMTALKVVGVGDIAYMIAGDAA